MSLGRAVAGTGIVPYVLGAIALVFVLLIVGVVVQSLRLGAAHNAAEAAQLEVKACVHDLRVETQNRETCDAKLADQNAAVDATAGECAQQSQQADERARQILRRPGIAVRDGTGPEFMNRWLAERLSSSR